MLAYVLAIGAVTGQAQVFGLGGEEGVQGGVGKHALARVGHGIGGAGEFGGQLGNIVVIAVRQLDEHRKGLVLGAGHAPVDGAVAHLEAHDVSAFGILAAPGNPASVCTMRGKSRDAGGRSGQDAPAAVHVIDLGRGAYSFAGAKIGIDDVVVAFNSHGLLPPPVAHECGQLIWV